MLIREYNLVVISSDVIEFYFLLYWKSRLHNLVFYFTQVIEYVKAGNTSFLKDSLCPFTKFQSPLGLFKSTNCL